MNPKPFSALNHFTVPVVMGFLLPNETRPTVDLGSHGVRRLHLVKKNAPGLRSGSWGVRRSFTATFSEPTWQSGEVTVNPVTSCRESADLAGRPATGSTCLSPRTAAAGRGSPIDSCRGTTADLTGRGRARPGGMAGRAGAACAGAYRCAVHAGGAGRAGAGHLGGGAGAAGGGGAGDRGPPAHPRHAAERGGDRPADVVAAGHRGPDLGPGGGLRGGVCLRAAGGPGCGAAAVRPIASNP